jgi:2-phospho-L-lactate guanylyltransferase (CobY/MobA/RfbA family)
VRTFTHVVASGIVTLVSDRHGDGTNVIALPATSPFRTSYGPGSFLLHRRHLEEMGLDYRCIDDAELALDLDTAEDLAELKSRSTT